MIGTGEAPEWQVVLEGTDWASLETPAGPASGGYLQAALAGLLDPDPAVRAAALGQALPSHQNTIYEATVPVAHYVAAILSHPATATAARTATIGNALDRPVLGLTAPRVVLLRWLGSTARDADDETVEIGERMWDNAFLSDYPAMRAFRDLRPQLYHAIRPLLDDEDEAVRHAGLVAAIPLAEHPELVPHRDQLAHHARRLLITSTDRYQRDRALDALQAWGHDTSTLETDADSVARARYARLATERLQPRAPGCGYSDEPPF
ncbi:hypothetical protein [Streptomyces sp. NPDC059874]|uniref:hypothetical protein n=1 Tax=Streptomyces sp. NPDC059874 TaxID=3346983 RepID=UPI0036521361